MKTLEVLYYYYYVYSIKILKDTEPHATTSFMLSLSETFFVTGIINFVASKYFCYSILTSKWNFISIFLVILLINYLHFQNSGRSRIIAKEKPVLFSSDKYSRVFVFLFWLITTSWMFWVVPLTNHILKQCN